MCIRDRGTPGRLMDHISRGSLKLDALGTLVLDEADRMLDMGFFDDIAYVAKACPKQRQTLLFSATYPEGVVRLARQFMRQPQEISLPEQHAAETIRQRFYEVAPDQRLHACLLYTSRCVRDSQGPGHPHGRQAAGGPAQWP